MCFKNPVINFVAILIGLCVAHQAYAQDRVFLTAGKIVEGKITEVGPTQVKMLLNVRPDGPVYTFNINSVDSIIYGNGTKEDLKGFAGKRNLRENIPQLNTWTYDILGHVFLSISQSYERRLKSGIVGFRVPLYIGYLGGGIAGEGIFMRPDGVQYPNNGGKHSFSIATGLNPRFYLFKRRVVRAFAGPEVTLGFSESMVNQYTDFYNNTTAGILNQNGTFAATGKFGLSFNPTDKFNMAIEGGAGIGDLFGGVKPLGVVGLWHIGLSMGTNF